MMDSPGCPTQLLNADHDGRCSLALAGADVDLIAELVERAWAAVHGWQQVTVISRFAVLVATGREVSDVGYSHLNLEGAIMTSSRDETNPGASGNDDNVGSDTAEARPDSPPPEGTGSPDDALPPPE